VSSTCWYIPLRATNSKIVAGQGRNPFPFVNENASAETDDGTWLYLGMGNWQIGDNVEFPSSLLLIRKVNKDMVEFIIKHFEFSTDVIQVWPHSSHTIIVLESSSPYRC
jgi:hypothetical protein